jgi:hypothetical protein
MKHILYFIKPIPETKLCPESYMDNIFDKTICAELIHTTYGKKKIAGMTFNLYEELIQTTYTYFL